MGWSKLSAKWVKYAVGDEEKMKVRDFMEALDKVDKDLGVIGLDDRKSLDRRKQVRQLLEKQ